MDAGSDGTTGMDDCTHPVSVYVYCAAPEIRVAPGLAPVGNASPTGSSGVTNGADAAKHRDTRGGIPNSNSDPVSVTSNTRPPPASVTVATTSATSDCPDHVPATSDRYNRHPRDSHCAEFSRNDRTLSGTVNFTEPDAAVKFT